MTTLLDIVGAAFLVVAAALLFGVGVAFAVLGFACLWTSWQLTASRHRVRR